MTRKVKRPGRAVAAHEAAHVVVGVHAGLKLRWVKVGACKVAGITYEGGTLFHGQVDGGRRRIAFGLMFAAGVAHEQVYRGKLWTGYIDRRIMRDDLKLSSADCSVLIGLARVYLEGPGRVAHELITRALEERACLTGDEVQEILDGRE